MVTFRGTDLSLFNTTNDLGILTTTNILVDLSLGSTIKFKVATDIILTLTNNNKVYNKLTFIINDGGSHSITWPPSVTWLSKTQPVLKESGTDVIYLITTDNGNTWSGDASPTTVGKSLTNIDTILTTDNWVDANYSTNNYYIYNITNSSIRVSSILTIAPNIKNISASQLASYESAILYIGNVFDNVVEIRSYGTKPLISIPVTITIEDTIALLQPTVEWGNILNNPVKQVPDINSVVQSDINGKIDNGWLKDTINSNTTGNAATATHAVNSDNATHAVNSDNATNASNAAVAAKLGTANIGSASTPLYLNAGAPVACNYIDSRQLKQITEVPFVRYDVARYNNNSNNDVTGTIKITLPVTWNNTLMSIEIDMYDYKLSKASKIIIGGYNYTGESTWYNCSTSVIGNYNKNIRLAHDGTNCCILLGDTTSSWYRPSISINKLICTWSGALATINGDWTISLITDETGLTKIVTPTINSGMTVQTSRECTGNALTATTASKVSNPLTLKINSGTTEGTTMYSFNGSTSKTLDIKSGTNVSFTATGGILTISSTDTNTTYTAGTGLTLTGTTFSLANHTHNDSEIIFSDITNGNATNLLHGYLPKLSNNTSQYLRGDGIWAIPHDTIYLGGTGIFINGTIVNLAQYGTAGTYGPTTNNTLTYGGTFTVPSITTDAYGRTTCETKTYTLPISDNTDTHWTSGLITGNDNNDTSNTAATNGNVYLNLVENGIVRNAHKLAGTGATTVTSDASGNITVSSTNTTYSAGTGISLSGTSFGLSSGVNSDPGTFGTNTAGTLALGSSFIIPKVTVDTYGRLTSTSDTTLTLPSNISWSSVSSKPTTLSGYGITDAYTKTYIDSLLSANDAMVFKGTIGTSGTVTALPTSGYHSGWTYKVTTAGTYAGNICEVGDLIICTTSYVSAFNNSDWTVSQSNIDGAVTGPASSTDNSIATFNGATGKIIKNSGYTIATSVPANAKFTDTVYTHPNTITAGSFGNTTAETLAFGGTFNIPYIVYNANGHLTSVGSKTITIPANPNTDTHWTSGLFVGNDETDAMNASATNGNVYLNLVENGIIRNAHKIIGSGASTVTSDASGNITISSTNTTYSAGTGISLSGTLFGLSTSGVTANTYGINETTSLAFGGSFAVPKIIVDSYGRLTSASNTTLTLPSTLAWSSVTSKPTTIDGYGITDTYTKTYIDSLLSSNDVMVIKGTIGTGGTVAVLPVSGYNAGWAYKVITAGTYAGIVCNVNDLIVCISNYDTSFKNSDWASIQSSIAGAVTGPASSTDNSIATFNGTTGKIIKNSGYTIATSVPANAKFTDTTYSAVTTSANGLMSSTDKSKLDGISSGAEVNQNTFSNIVVGSSTIAADSKTDTLTLTAGTNISLTPNTTTGSVTISNTLTDTNYYPTAFSWTNGTTSGPTGTLSGSGMSAVSVGAIPSASVNNSGIITTSTQNIAGAKTFTNISTHTNGIRIDGTYIAGINMSEAGGNAWQMFVSHSGTSKGIDRNMTIPSGSIVTGYAMRNIASSSTAGNGWTWETVGASVTNTSTSIVAEMTAADGNFRTKGNITVNNAVTLNYNTSSKCLEFNFV